MCPKIKYKINLRLVGEEYKSYSFLNSALDGGKWFVSRSGRALRTGKDHVTHWIGGGVGPRTGLGA